jgi:hypothetical protein
VVIRRGRPFHQGTCTGWLSDLDVSGKIDDVAEDLTGLGVGVATHAAGGQAIPTTLVCGPRRPS